MNCPEVRERLSDHALGENSTKDRVLIEGHLAGCADCAAEREGLRETIDLLAAHEWSAGEGLAELTPERRRRLEERAARKPRGWNGLLLKLAAVLTLVTGAASAWVSLLRYPMADRVLYGPMGEATPHFVPEGQRGARPAARTAVRTPTAPPTTIAPGETVDWSTPRATKRAPDPTSLTVSEATTHPNAPAPTLAPGPSGGPRRYDAETLARLRALGYLQGDGDSAGGDVDIAKLNPKTPGLVPPNGAPAPDMYFEHAGTNPFVETAEDALSTFGLDVDTASYAIARNYISRGALPPASAVRVEEFVNAFPQDYRADAGKAFTVHVEGAPNPFHPGYHLLRVGIKAREVAERERKPVVLTFVIDVSGSMNMENRLGLVKRSLRLLVEKLDERDRIGLVVYGSSGRVVLEPTPVSEGRTILGAIETLVPEGSTNLEQGLDLGYAMARRAFNRELTNRVILCTDGVANNGVTDAATLLKHVHGQAEKGVDLIALGFGMGNYNDILLQKLADEGDGQYAYIDDFPEAERFFLRDLTQVLEVVARDAKAQVEFDPARVERYRLLGYEKRDVADDRFRDDTVDGGEVNSGHTVTVLYEVKLKGEARENLGAVHLRYADPVSRKVTEVREAIRGARFRAAFASASPRFRLTALVARFAEHLRKSYWAKGERLQRVVDAARGLPADLLREEQAREFLEMLEQAVRLQAPERQ